MSNHVQYALNSGAWFIGGTIAASVLWRAYFHRELVKLGKSKKEQPLAVFVAFMVGAVSVMGLLFSESSKLALDDYVHCNASVNQRNVDTINDRSKSIATQLRGEIKFYQDLAEVLSTGPDSGVRTRVLGSLMTQIGIDQTRLSKVLNNPLQPISDCHKADS